MHTTISRGSISTLVRSRRGIFLKGSRPLQASNPCPPSSTTSPPLLFSDEVFRNESQPRHLSTERSSQEIATIRASLGMSSVRYLSTAVEKEESEDSPAQQFQYQAEVSRLLNLIVHSLYSHKEVFLRELVSNASDALDKLRFLSVTDPSLLGDYPNLEIKIRPDPEAGILTITDTGIGMSREELIRSLGTIAESGTAKFMQALKDNKDGSASDSNLIGQFGVGFYSAFLVAEKVTVTTRKAGSDKQYIWTGHADNSSYSITEEIDSRRLLPRGTSVTLYLKKDDRHEYSELSRIQSLVKNYSQFLSFPIYMWRERSRTVDDALEEMDAEATELEKSKEKKKTKVEKYYEWELVNEAKPIWLRVPKETTKEEYNDFFKKTFDEYQEPMAHSHFSTEGEVEFKSLLYIPASGPTSPEDLLNRKNKNIRLYVKRVFISDEFNGELFPRYLGFVKGVVDSNDLPLNVSREILQQSNTVHVMRKRLVRKTFDMIDDMAKNSDPEVYKNFWTRYGKFIKLGCIEDTSNHKRLGRLLRFYSSKHDKEMTSLEAYVRRMKPDQKSIYYMAADSIQSAKNAPFLEDLSIKDIEVLFLVDPIDEVTVTNLQSFNGKKFVDISKEDLGDESSSQEALHKEFTLLCDWIKYQLGEKIERVQVSKRSGSYPCVLTTGKFGFSPNMERIIRAQALGDANPALDLMRSKRVLEINPNHPIIKNLNDLYGKKFDNVDLKRLVEVLYETAVLASGFVLDEPATFGNKVYGMLGTVLDQSKSSTKKPLNEPAQIVEEVESELVS